MVEICFCAPSRNQRSADSWKYDASVPNQNNEREPEHTIGAGDVKNPNLEVRKGDHASTFGGNPVSCAASLANIAFFEKVDLPGQSARKGVFAMERLNALKAKYPIPAP